MVIYAYNPFDYKFIKDGFHDNIFDIYFVRTHDYVINLNVLVYLSVIENRVKKVNSYYYLIRLVVDNNRFYQSVYIDLTVLTFLISEAPPYSGGYEHVKK